MCVKNRTRFPYGLQNVEGTVLDDSHFFVFMSIKIVSLLLKIATSGANDSADVRLEWQW